MKTVKAAMMVGGLWNVVSVKRSFRCVRPQDLVLTAIVVNFEMIVLLTVSAAVNYFVVSVFLDASVRHV